MGQLAVSNPFSSFDTQTCNNVYDDLLRLVSDNCGTGWVQTFSFDAFGNISSTGSLSFQPTYTLSTNHFFTLAAGTPAYDPNGNVQNDGVHSYTWNAEGRMAGLDSGTPATYDALGRLVEWFSYRQEVYAPNGAGFATMAGSSVILARVPLSGGAIADYSASGLNYYMHSDWLGSTRLNSTPARTVQNASSVATPSPFSFPEYALPDFVFIGVAEFDRATDIWTFPARDYEQRQDRWLSPDPAGLAAVDPSNPQTWNRYAYVNNNPLSNVDPTGMWTSFGPTGTPRPPSAPQGAALGVLNLPGQLPL